MAQERDSQVDTWEFDGKMVFFRDIKRHLGTVLTIKGVPSRGGMLPSVRKSCRSFEDITDMVIEATAVETLQNQFSGYGSTSKVVARCLDRAGIKEPLEHWSDETIEKVVNAFTDEKFPTVIALNKIDHPDSDKNIAKIAKSNPAESLVLTSAISEVFLRKLVKQGYIKYTEGTEIIDTREDLIEQGDPDGGGLKPMDDKLKTRLENLRDLVLFRFGGTGVVQVLSRIGQLLGLVPVFPVRSIQNFGATSTESRVFRDCVLVRK
jgi:ribosome-binding ATPase